MRQDCVETCACAVWPTHTPRHASFIVTVERRRGMLKRPDVDPNKNWIARSSRSPTSVGSPTSPASYHQHPVHTTSCRRTRHPYVAMRFVWETSLHTWRHFEDVAPSWQRCPSGMLAGRHAQMFARCTVMARFAQLVTCTGGGSGTRGMLLLFASERLRICVRRGMHAIGHRKLTVIGVRGAIARKQRRAL